MNSILVSALGVVDALLCVLVALAACDYLRRIRPVDHPLLCTAFYMVAIGAFGAFVTSIQGHWVNPFGVMLHAGMVLYAWARRGHIFADHHPVGGYQAEPTDGKVAPPPKNP